VREGQSKELAIASTRVLLAASSIFAIYIDPSKSSVFENVTYLLLTAYLLYSIIVMVAVLGMESDRAVPYFYGTRMTIAIGAFVLFATPILFRPNVAVGLGGSLLGYILPGIVLARMAKKRKHKMQLALADALDLMVVSVEAGLGLDQAIIRVADELAFAYPDLSDELKLVNIELRAGKARTEALRNLGDRTGLEDVASLTTMLIQTDKFGTSVAQSLRVHSETLGPSVASGRKKRRRRPG